MYFYVINNILALLYHLNYLGSCNNISAETQITFITNTQLFTTLQSKKCYFPSKVLPHMRQRQFGRQFGMLKW